MAETVMFICGGDGAHVVVRDSELQERAWAQTEAWARKVERERFAATGEAFQYPTIDEQGDYYDDAYKAEERRVTMAASIQIDAAIELLEKHGFAISPPSVSVESAGGQKP